MGEKILTEEAIEEKLRSMAKHEVRYIDPYKLAQWTLQMCCAMVDNAVSEKTLLRAIERDGLEAFKAGAKITIEPAKFLLWYRRFKK